jgi:hypothetical protein
MMEIIRCMHAGLLMLVLLTACGASGAEPAQPAQGVPDIRGTVTDLQLAGAGGQQILGTALIEGPIADGTRFDQASVRITSETRIWEQQGTEHRAVAVEALATGQRVEARFSGPVAESYPVQATAAEIVILR